MVYVLVSIIHKSIFLFAGHFYLTVLLLDKLKASAPSRVVCVSSDGHKFKGKLNFKDLQLKHSYHSAKAYGQSKTCNILFAVHLAKLLRGISVQGTMWKYTGGGGVLGTGTSRKRGALGTTRDEKEGRGGGVLGTGTTRIK